MFKYSLYLLIFFTFMLITYCKQSYAKHLSPTSAYGEIAGTVELSLNDFLYLEWKASENPIHSCSVQTPGNVVIPLGPSLNETSRIRYIGYGFSSGYCGVNVSSVQTQDNGTWVLKTDPPNQVQSNVTVKVPPTVQNDSTIQAVEGKPLKVLCGPLYPVYCEMTSPEGELTIYNNKQCTTVISAVVTKSHQGIWKCKYITDGATLMQLSEVLVYVSEQKPNIEIGYNETSSEVHIFCNLLGVSGCPVYCRITTPLGEDLFLAPGKGTSRYRYYGTDWECSGKVVSCGVTITKPLHEHEHGNWLCEPRVAERSEIRRGGYIFVGRNPTEKTQVFGEYEKQNFTMTPAAQIVYVQNGTSLHIPCHANASLEYCWYRRPNGGQVLGNELVLGKGWNFGYCDVKLYSATFSDAGEWSCSGGVKGLNREVINKITVVVTEDSIHSIPKILVSNVGEPVQFKCAHSLKQRITYCRFVRPDRTGLKIDETNKGGDYIYAGKGFSVGECGILIKRVKSSDFGNWTCVISVSESEISTNIMLSQEEGLSVAAYLGIALGCLVFGVIGFLVIKFFKPYFVIATSEETTPLTEASTVNIFQITEDINKDVPRRRRIPERRKFF